ncbi:MAG TPA: two-component regulator propeller domain-containing protein, partial [Terracidiphilus sp.]
MKPFRAIPYLPAALRVLALLVVFPAAAQALVPTTPLGNLNRQSWTMENGLPQNTIQAMAQSTDGFLWLGTEAGLVRFDGIQFALFDRASKPALPDNDVRCLLAKPDGSLVVVTADGAVSLNRDSVAPTSEICSANVLQARYDDGHVGGWSAEASRDSVTVTAVVEKMQLRLEAGKQLPGSRIQVLLADHEGALWIGTNRGLARVVNGKVEKLPVTDPLATASVISLLEDSEGNLWVGTETGGLHVLRDQRFVNIGAPEGLSA